MFSSENEIYHHIGQAMYNALPDKWDEAWIEVVIFEVDSSIQAVQGYNNRGKENNFSVNKIDDKFVDSNYEKAFYDLYKLMKKSEDDEPWNKARFQLTSDGNFAIDFKFDDDFAYLKSLDPDGDEYDNLDIEIERQILSWQGLPDDVPRPWRETL